MTYKRATPPTVVQMDDGELTVTYRRMSIGQLVDMRALQDMSGVDRESVLARYTEIADALALAVIEWDYVDEHDQPVPITQQTMRDQDAGFLIALARGWMDSAVTMPAPLAQRSTGGGPSLVESTLPQESLSESPPN